MSEPFESGQKPVVVAFVPDLMDQSKLRSAPWQLHFARRPADVAELAQAEGATQVVLDLSRPPALAIVSDLVDAGLEVVGFASHIDDETIAAAEAAGCQEVLPRSVFFRRMASEGQ